MTLAQDRGRTGSRRGWRWAIALALLPLLAFGGCIYFRLLTTKRQLADFENYVDVAQSERGLSFVFKEPHLTANDLNRLGIWPVDVHELDGSSIWKSGFVKKTPNGSPEPERDLWLYLTIHDGLLAEIRVPQKNVEVFTAPIIVEAVKAFGDSRVDSLQKVISITWDSDRHPVDFITPERIESALGQAYRVEGELDSSTITYLYRKPNLTEDDEAGKEYTVQFLFAGDTLEELKTRAVRIDFAEN